MRKLSYPALLPLVLCCLLLTSNAHAEQTRATVLVLGDSISAAYGMSLEQGWVALLDQRLQENGTTASVVNASISGETTGGGLRRLPALLDQYSPALVIVELGGNDGLRGFTLQTLHQNLTQIVELAQASGARVLLLPMEIPPNYGQRYARAFRQTFAQVAEDTGCELGPFILESFATNRAMMQPDGIHPTVDAQALILEAVLADVVTLLGG